MDYHKRSIVAAVMATCVTGAAFMPGSALAEAAASEPAAATDNTLQEIVVTAQKRSQSINDVGLTITALGADTLAKRGIKTLEDLAKSVPGLTYSDTDFARPIFTLRGVGYYDYSLGGYPTTSVYVDQAPLPFAALAAHANLDLERVEVLKGPQGTLFGENSTGGAINFIAAKPTNKLTSGVDVTIGRFGQGDVGGYVSGPLTDTLSARLAVEQDFGGDWQHSYTRNDSLGQRNVSVGRLLLQWTPNDRVNVLVNLNGWVDKSDPQAPQFIAIFPQLTLPGNKSAVKPTLEAYPFAPANDQAADWSPDHRPTADNNQYQATMRVDYNLTNNIGLTSLTSYIGYHTSSTFDNDGTNLNVFQYVDTGSIRSFTQELRLAGGEGTPFRWIAGGNYERIHTLENTFQTYPDSTVGILYGNNGGKDYTDLHMRNYAVFANGDYDVLPKLTLKLGGRYTNSRQTAAACTYDDGDGTANAISTFFAKLIGHPLSTPLKIGDCTNFLANFVPGVFTDTLQEDNFSWRGGVDYKPTRNVLLYANVAKGYKAGSFPVVGTTSFESYLPVTQESLLDYEVGFKAQFFDRKIGLDGAAFYYDYANKQLLTKRVDPLVGAIPALANIPKSRVIGAELELTAAPVESLLFSAGLTYLDGQITQYTGVNAATVPTNFAGTPIPFTPTWQYQLTADYNFPIEGGIRPFVGASLSGRTDTSSIIGSAVGAIINPGYRSSVPLASTYDLPAYWTLDLRAGVASADGTWRLWVWGKNVTDKYYWNNVVTAFEVIDRYAGQPATYGVTLNYKFR
jgi:iron complex outermembrane recepter protein